MSNKSIATIATMGIDIGKNSFHVVGLDRRGAMDSFVQISADVPDIGAEFEPVRTVALVNTLVRLCDRRYAIGRFLEVQGQRWIIHFAGLELEHARHDGETVLDAMCPTPAASVRSRLARPAHGGRDDDLRQSLMARWPACVMQMRAIVILRLSTLMVSRRAVASPSPTKSANISMRNP
jgi:hypothetical protein